MSDSATLHTVELHFVYLFGPHYCTAPPSRPRVSSAGARRWYRPTCRDEYTSGPPAGAGAALMAFWLAVVEFCAGHACLSRPSRQVGGWILATGSPPPSLRKRLTVDNTFRLLSKVQ
ncbi:hypothetical protein E2C01_029993 [Portunus trituberculatus]|uniref:Uncharacterized protein n=1 Tax=Portunus trituberculatus TaxID=210409 RepID=A0A5B7EPR9_PORTR|nr:hypothetical protein [Portunus trituberculatus]